MAPELVIFDCDGVLVDSERIALRINVEIGPALGWAITPDEVMQHFLGRSNASIREVIAERLTPEAAALWDECFIDRTGSSSRPSSRPSPGSTRRYARSPSPPASPPAAATRRCATRWA